MVISRLGRVSMVVQLGWAGMSPYNYLTTAVGPTKILKKDN